MSLDQIHIGVGRDVVGAILPVSLDAGHDVHVIADPSSELVEGSELVCSVCGEGGRRHDMVLPIASLSIAGAISQIDPRARAVLLASPELLLTTALPSTGIEVQTHFLLELARVRAGEGKPTTMIVCEEVLRDSHPQLLSELRTLGVDARRGLVNRLCSREPLASGRLRRAVRADEHVEWLIEGRPDSALLHSLAQAEGVVVSEHFEQHALRMRWLAYGRRLALALLAAEANQPQLHVFAARNTDWLLDVGTLFIPLVESRCPDLSDTPAYAARQLKALMRYYDDGYSALSKLRRARLLPFMRELDATIGEPCRELMRARGGGELPRELRRLLVAIEVVLGDVARYSDFSAYAERDMVIDVEGDEQAVEAYERMLNEILPAEKVNERKLSLAYQLELHRGEL